MNILFLLIGLVLGFGMAFLFLKNKNNSTKDVEELNKKNNSLDKEKSLKEQEIIFLKNDSEKKISEWKQERENLISENLAEREKVIALNMRIAKAEEAFSSMKEKLSTQKIEMEELQKKFSVEFENIANKILEDKSKKFTEQNKTNLDIILNPLKEKIKDFEEKVDKAYKAESTERTTLKAEIKNLIDLNKQVSEDANNLAKALKGDNKKQGNWGEIILEKVLERSGLVKDQEYRTQFSTTNDENNRIQPDVVILLPDNKHIVVDSKVSLIAYEAFVNATSEEDKEKYIKEHIASVRNHVKMLSEKNYQTSPDFNTPDFVLLFIPIESSFSVAVQADQEIFNYAWDKKIVIVSPSTLLATLRTIASVWKQERQTKNALEIARQSGNLYDKFVGFVEDLEKIGKSIDTSKSAYESAFNKLKSGSGNLIKRAQDIEKLGAKSTKKLSEKLIESDEEKGLDEQND
ncbi:MAG: DNA recombination protein RmuC [Bacteroidia bacterium]